MQTQITIGYKQILNLAYLLPKDEKQKLILDLQESIENKIERKFGEYNGLGWISDDFNEPLEELKEYMP